jgi:hypothetical protein
VRCCTSLDCSAFSAHLQDIINSQESVWHGDRAVNQGSARNNERNGIVMLKLEQLLTKSSTTECKWQDQPSSPNTSLASLMTASDGK